MILTHDDLITRATNIPNRPLAVSLRSYIDLVRMFVNGSDPINIPPSHAGLMNGENHEGSQRLNKRIRQLAAWFGRGEMLFDAELSGPGDKIQRAGRAMQRFARAGEREFNRGTQLHNWKQECLRDFAEVGWSAYLQTPRADYYDQAALDPQKMADGSKLTSAVLRRRIDPYTLSWEERLGGGMGTSVIETERQLGELAQSIGFEAAARVLGTLDVSEAVDASDPQTWNVMIKMAEVWGDENGGLVFMGGGTGTSMKSGSGLADLGPEIRVLREWRVTGGKVPIYIAKAGPQPWTSPLDDMVGTTGERNFWATMQDIQAAGAIFRHWQLVDSNTGEDASGFINKDAVPEHLLYDVSKPPPDMGPGTEWKLAPFEMLDVKPRYENIVMIHEQAGASVARLHGEQVNQNTPVGTADMIDEMAQKEFGDWVEALELQAAEAWADLFQWLRVDHKDPLYVADKRRDTETDPTSYLAVPLTLSGADVVTTELETHLDLRSRLSKIADYRLGREMQNNGDTDFHTRVAKGLVPFVDDADEEVAAIYVDTRMRVELETQIHADQQLTLQSLMGYDANAAAVAQAKLPPHGANITGGSRTDPRGSGVGQGGDNIANTALSPGASDLLRTA